jgi:tetratricopeptide (TPR) repeat protein
MSKTRRKVIRTQPQPRTDPAPTPAARPWVPDIWIYLALIVAIFALYAPVRHFDFTTYDDNLYVSENVHVEAGLTPASIRWALTAVVSSNWLPVTLLSHMLDVQLFGLRSGMHHLMNVVYHALATLLLLACLLRATGARWPSAFVAFLFALHPLHIGSVAWIAERKDVLSAFFWFLALFAYIYYAERPSLRRYLPMAAAFCLGLMSKPMLVTFPFVLLLFDVWPLRRFQPGHFSKLAWEKAPLIALSAAASGVTYFVQKSTGAVQAIPFTSRIENALISYVVYVGQMFWPTRLAVIYPFPNSVQLSEAIIALLLLLALTVGAVLAWRTRPYLSVGWFWFLGTLIPVIGLVQVGAQAHADRYMYIPMVGLAIVLGWGGADVIAQWPRTKTAIAIAAVAGCASSMAIASTQLVYWRNSETLFLHAVDVTENNWVAEDNLSHYLMVTGRIAEAIPHFEAGLRMKPEYAEAHNNLGACFSKTGRKADAIRQFEAAIKFKPDFADAHFNLALVFSGMPGRAVDAVAQYEAALRSNPDHEEAHKNLAVLLVSLGRTDEAFSHLEAALRLNPDYRNEHNLGAVLSTKAGRQSEAIAHLEAAQRLHPDPETAKIIDRLRAGLK